MEQEQEQGYEREGTGARGCLRLRWMAGQFLLCVLIRHPTEGLVFHVEVEFSGFPVVAGLGQAGGIKRRRGFHWGRRGHAGAAFDINSE